MTSNKSPVIINYQRQLNEADSLLNACDIDSAKAIYQDLIRKFPNRMNAYLGLIKVFAAQDKKNELLNTAQETLNKFPTSQNCLQYIIDALLAVNCKHYVADILQKFSQNNGSTTEFTAAMLTGTALISKEKVKELVCNYNFPQHIADACCKTLEYKAETYEIIKNFDFNIVSLGKGCLPSSLISRWAMGPSVREKSVRLPFDLAIHPSPLSLLRSSFEGYASLENLDIDDGNTEIFIKSMPSGTIRFNHDPAKNYNWDKNVFVDVLAERVRSFYDTITKKQTLLFMYCNAHPTLKEIKEYQKFLSQFCHNHKLLIVAGKHDKEPLWIEHEIFDNIYILKTHQPQGEWWTPHNLISEAYFNFYRIIIDDLTEIIKNNFKPHQQERIVSIDEMAQNEQRKLIYEIAAEYNVKEYLGELRLAINGSINTTVDNARTDITGAIVMNCNPFTLGHRYLIEQAAAKVDKLIIFVVEEDLSFFKFKDRYDLVRKGTSDIPNVHVVRSGKFIISTVTFPSYFTKENPDLSKFDASQDIGFFGEIIAPALGISVRFLGSEPTCQITNAYNQQLMSTLPKYGIAVEIIPRKEFSGKAISASLVREYLKTGESLKIKNLVPESTYQFLTTNYMAHHPKVK